MNISNKDFLTAIFGESMGYAHVTSFTHDPNAIPQLERGIAWAGGYYKDYQLKPDSNQFYAVSLFKADEHGIPRRRKALFSACYVIGLDDVREKLDQEAVDKLPAPSIIIQTSKHSEQWLYILDQPCTNRNRIDNLHDGLISRGLAPDGKDPGQKGVTRYLRLPEGINNKASRVEENDGVPWQVQVTHWWPENRYSLEALAQPFGINLDAPRRQMSVEGAAAIPDHPLLQTDLVTVKAVLSDGRFDITCPWVDEHTDMADDGTAIFTNRDGGMGFKCHHGHCEGRTGRDLIRWLDAQQPGFSDSYKIWQLRHTLNAAKKEAPPPPPTMAQVQAEADIKTVQDAIDQLKTMDKAAPETRDRVGDILKIIDSSRQIDRIHYHDCIKREMGWSQKILNEVIDDFRSSWYNGGKSAGLFYSDIIYIAEQNRWYNPHKRIWYTKESLHNAFADQDNAAGKNAIEGMTEKVDKIDYAPGQPSVFVEDGVSYANSYQPHNRTGVQGDISIWYNHFDELGWGGDDREHVLNWMAYTIQHPERKINHALILGGAEGVGKDFLLQPLFYALGHNATIIQGDELLLDFNSYLLSTKLLYINEVELAGNNKVENRLKPLCAAPPERIRVNQKGIQPLDVRNIVNCVISTNSSTPLKISAGSRRYYMLWTDLQIKDRLTYSLKPEWRTYWTRAWHWLEHEGGMDAVIHYLRHRDVSEFNPGDQPATTQATIEMMNDSKTLLVITIETFFDERIGIFQRDLLSMAEMETFLKDAGKFYPHKVYVEPREVDQRKIAKILKLLGAKSIKATVYGKESRLWLLRNPEKYEGMSKAELGALYNAQKAKYHKAPHLELVPPPPPLEDDNDDPSFI